MARTWDIVTKIPFGISVFIKLSLIIAIATSAWNGRYFILFISSLAFLFTFLPSLIEWQYNVHVPFELEFMMVLFIYSSLFLGEVHGYYTRYWWWDVLLHSIASLAMGVVGFLAIYVLYYEDKIKSSAFLIAVFAFSFAVAIGAVWEIFEFAVDSFLGTAMQKSGLVDTMWDLIVNSLGALIASVAGFFYTKYGQTPLLERVFSNFLSENKHLRRSNNKL